LFESHIDTVPAVAGWAEHAWSPRIEDHRLFGLGACDDKGCLTAMIVALLELLEQGRQPPRSVILVCAGDEEYAQTGIHRYLKDAAESLAYGVFGEPTQLFPVVQHKGTIRWDLTVHGRSAHTARPELGVNAIHGMMDVIAALKQYQEALQDRHANPLLTGPTITVTQIAGGRTRNAVPDECTIAVDFRVVPGMDPAAERYALIGHLLSLPWEISHRAVQLTTPPLSTPIDSPVSRRILSICRELVDPRAELQGAPYGTDAAWAGTRCPAIVLGPGDIRHAHAVDEQILLSDVAAAVEVYQRIMLDPFEQLP
jgi:acetylornithine deacetylase/succinyl-diaminopimelate desuccinylase-like protein